MYELRKSTQPRDWLVVIQAKQREKFDWVPNWGKVGGRGGGGGCEAAVEVEWAAETAEVAGKQAAEASDPRKKASKEEDGGR